MKLVAMQCSYEPVSICYEWTLHSVEHHELSRQYSTTKLTIHEIYCNKQYFNAPCSKCEVLAPLSLSLSKKKNHTHTHTPNHALAHTRMHAAHTHTHTHGMSVDHLPSKRRNIYTYTPYTAASPINITK